jgi:uncharacterized membrane protein
MPIFYYNDSWMIYNCFLALLPVGFGFLFILIKNPIIKTFFGVLWLLFLPNTIYIFTDLEHLIEQWPLMPLLYRIPLLLQYIILVTVGIGTFFVALYPFEKLVLMKKRYKQKKYVLLIVFNFFIAFGMVLGRVERINSWQVFTDPMRVIDSAITVLTSLDLLIVLILFGLFCNFLYFLFRRRFLSYMNNFSNILD